ncbi:MAG: hypothetical protein V1740_06810 [Candidatus Woesearchaeota archaeon]
MAEREIIVDRNRLTYEGLFSVIDLYTMIDEFFEDKGYDKREKKNVERVKAEGKYIELELEPWKKLTDYAKSVIKVRILMSDIKEVEVEKEGVKVKLNQGKVQFVFDAYLETDYEHRWEMKPMFFFIRTLLDKFAFKNYTVSFKNEVKSDLSQLIIMIRSFLNLYRQQ